VGHCRTFSYSIPEEKFSLEPGQLVWVPLRRRVTQGLVMSLADAPQVEVTRDVLQPVEPSPLLSPLRLQLATWLSQYYRCSLFSAVELLLPPGFKAQVRSRISPLALDESRLESLRPQAREALEKLGSHSHLSEAEFVKLLGRNGSRELDRMADAGLVSRQVDLPRPRTFRYQRYLLPTSHPPGGAEGTESLIATSERQKRLLTAVQSHGGSYPASLANKLYGSGVANTLVEKGLLAEEWVREPVDGNGPAPAAATAPALTLTPPQADALGRIAQAIDDPQFQPRSFLLHGVTGSGKTEVYLRAMRRVVARGQQGIFLVPEISLTPQTVERVNARFPGRVAVLHSGLTEPQKFDRWWRIRDGEYDVVVGPRSALFAPVPNLGLIVIDEEHEWTYKQDETHPLYHARTVALELSRLTGAAVVMGSATPDVETYFRATESRGAGRSFRLLELPRRVSGNAAGPGPNLAPVEVIDMRRELREGNRNIFSRALASGLTECLAKGEQAILFLNRRGTSSIVLCRDCGHAVTCPSCSVSLTYHSGIGRLLCHRCNRRRRTPQRCPACRGEHIRQLGIGTERVVAEVSRLLPGARVDRLDADAARSGQGAEEAMRRLSTGETQVLVGTQMVAKGLDVPNVTVVGAVLADVGMFLPDFRSGERVFSLLCQVAGRAGRGNAQGRVYVQTYNPHHYAVLAAANQDYQAMYDHEIAARLESGYPPFNDLVHFVYQNTDPNACQRQAASAARELKRRAHAYGRADVEVTGPSPGIPQRLRGRYRWRVLLRGRELASLLEGMDFPQGCTVDVDPAHVL
jgi:primosomal protein N' (replication factor Y)